MASPSVVICEASGVWAALLKRSGFSGPITETRSLLQCGEALATHPQHFAVICAASFQLDQVAEFIAWHARWCTVVLDRGSEAYEPAMREAGAVDVVYSTRQVQRVVKVLQCHFQRLPQPEIAWSDAVWQRLPWQRHAAMASRAGDTKSS